MMAGFNKFGAIAAALPKVLGDIVTETAQQGEQNVKQQIEANGQVASGFMRDAVYHKTIDESTYGQAGSPPGDAYLLPEVDAPPDNQTAYFAAGANYSVYQNYGTRYMAGRAFFEPGVQQTQVFMDDQLGTVESRIKGMI
jgi:hypothetical protein